MKEARRLKITLITKEPFRIGAFENVMSAIHNPVATVGGRAVIQGSSLKGALRTAIEDYLIQECSDIPEMKPCIPSPENTLSQDEKELIEKGKYRKGGGCHYSERNKSSSICPVCYLLGATGVSGFVRVPYLYTDVAPEELYAVRIDRATNVVREKTNRDYQIIKDGTKFEGELEILIKDSRRNWTLGEKRSIGKEARGFYGDSWLNERWNAERIIKELIKERLEDINILGGFKSRGCGKVEIKVNGTQ